MLLNFKSMLDKYKLNIRGVIHIGGFEGEEYQTYKNNNINEIVFYEPRKDSFDILKQIAKEAMCINKALGNRNQKINMNIATNGQSSSILKPKTHTAQYPSILFNRVDVVDMVRLDDEPLDFKLYNFVNIDVQGYELEVFNGASNVLKGIDCIMAEINREELYEGCTQVTQLVEFLKEYGFRLVEQTWDGGSWGDGLFIKRG